MSAPATTGVLPPPPGGDRPDPAQRGITRISPVAVERVAVHACRPVLGLLTRENHPTEERAPATRVRAEVMGNTAHLAVTVGVRYPAPLLPIAQEIRRVVSAEVQQMCGLEIIGVDVTPVPIVIRRTSRVR